MIKTTPRFSNFIKRCPLILVRSVPCCFYWSFSILKTFSPLIPKGEALLSAKYVVLFLGIAKLTDMLTSINGQIIGFSSRYRFNLYAVIFLGIVNVFLNIYLIDLFQITGAAIATAISLILYNLIKLGYVYYHFGFHPFSTNTLKLFGLVGISTIALIFFPGTDFLVLNIILRTLLTGVLFAIGIFYFKIAPDIIDFVKDRLPIKWKNK